jgi:alanine racemase
MSGHRPTEARIDLSAIRGNLGEVRRAAGHGVIAVVKADAYGHGASAVAAALAQAGCRVFAVLSVDEAEPVATRRSWCWAASTTKPRPHERRRWA